jgi:hypothetical protein
MVDADSIDSALPALRKLLSRWIHRPESGWESTQQSSAHAWFGSRQTGVRVPVLPAVESQPASHHRIGGCGPELATKLSLFI